MHVPSCPCKRYLQGLSNFIFLTKRLGNLFTTMADSLDSAVLDQLNTTEARQLHELTDKLTTCGVGRIVNLPQIIVVGEQSVGKSSGLEAVSHIRFPVKADICTRFPTEIVLRQAKETRVDVSVRFNDKSKPTQTIPRVGFNEDDLPGIIKEAKESIGIASTGREFSKNVLRLEIEGPNMYPLTLVDLPGLYHVETADQSMRGKETVDQLVESYMKQKNSIILVVVTAHTQLASHIALKMVKELDPDRDRTLGVITKPDLTRPGKPEEATIYNWRETKRAHISSNSDGTFCGIERSMRRPWTLVTPSKKAFLRQLLGLQFQETIAGLLVNVKN